MTPSAGRTGGLADRLIRTLPVVVRADARDRSGPRVPGDHGYEPEPPTPQLGERTGPPTAGERSWPPPLTSPT